MYICAETAVWFPWQIRFLYGIDSAGRPGHGNHLTLPSGSGREPSVDGSSLNDRSLLVNIRSGSLSRRSFAMLERRRDNLARFRQGLCQNHKMKHLLLACLFPMTLTAQTMQQLTEQLGKTVLYGDVALSPDGTHVAWVQSTAASTSKQTYIRETSGNASATLVKIPISGERTDFDPAWSPDSKTLAFFSSADEGEQRQLWSVNADGSGPKKLTSLNGYAARPRWSHNGKQIAFLYIEGAGGGGPLMAAPTTTGVIDTAIHNQRIAVLDVASGQLRQVSPENLHIYDFDWSPDDKTFVATAAPGPGDNNWWIAQIYTIDIAKGNARSIYKPSLQVAVPRWSPDGKSIAFIEGLMSDEGFHGGDLFTISASGADVQNRTNGRKSSVSSLFWLTPDRILLTEIVGGGGAISELTLADNSVRQSGKAQRLFTRSGIFLTLPFPRTANSQQRNAARLKRPPRSGSDRSVNGVS